MTQLLVCIYSIVAIAIEFNIFIVRETTFLTPLLDCHFDLISLNIENLSDDGIAMLESLTLLFFHAGILGDVQFPLGVDNALQLLVVIKLHVCLQGRELPFCSFCEIEWFSSNHRSG